MTALDPLAHHFHDQADLANDAHDHDELHAAGEVVELIAKGVFFPDESSYIGRWIAALQQPPQVMKFDPPIEIELDEDKVRAALEKYAPAIWETGRIEGILAACRTHGPDSNGAKLAWIIEVPEPTDDDNPYAGEPFDFEAHDHPERLDV